MTGVSRRFAIRVWTPTDTEIFRLAVPALGSLAAGPLYVLVDTAIVGHLGQGQLAGLGLAATVLGAALAMCNFLAYATTAHVGRIHAAGNGASARRVANDALWLAALLGIGFALLGVTGGCSLLERLGGNPEVAHNAYRYLGIAVFGLPFSLIAIAGQGYLRGVRDLRSPLVYVVAGNTLNVLLEVLFVCGFQWDLEGSASATVLAQGVMAAFFVARLLGDSGGIRRPSLQEMQPLLRASSQIFVRTTSLYGTFVVVGSTLSHMGAASVAAHQVLFQLWIFLALLLDSIAIAGQVLVSRAVGAGQPAKAVALGRRMIAWAVLAGTLFGAALLLFGGELPWLFTKDGPVLAQAAAAWPVFALMQPLNGAVFALDGILLGAGDSRYLMWSMLLSALVTVPLVLTAYLVGAGITGVWLAIAVLIAVRLLTTGLRFAGGRWAVPEPARKGAVGPVSAR